MPSSRRLRVLVLVSGLPGALGNMPFGGDVFAGRGEREEAVVGRTVVVAEVFLRESHGCFWTGPQSRSTWRMYLLPLAPREADIGRLCRSRTPSAATVTAAGGGEALGHVVLLDRHADELRQPTSL